MTAKCRGVFQEVNFGNGNVKVMRRVDAFEFEIHREQGPSEKEYRLALNLIIKADEDDLVKVNFEKLLPGWILKRVPLDWTREEAMKNLSCSAEAGELILNEFEDNDEVLNQKIDWSLEEVLTVAGCSERATGQLLHDVVDRFEKLLKLEIGEDAKGIYFSIRCAKQKVSIWDRVISEESLKGYIEIKRDGREVPY